MVPDLLQYIEVNISYYFIDVLLNKFISSIDLNNFLLISYEMDIEKVLPQ
jgi:hypothetical protein